MLSTGADALLVLAPGTGSSVRPAFWCDTAHIEPADIASATRQRGPSGCESHGAGITGLTSRGWPVSGRPPPGPDVRQHATPGARILRVARLLLPLSATHWSGNVLQDLEPIKGVSR